MSVAMLQVNAKKSENAKIWYLYIYIRDGRVHLGRCLTIKETFLTVQYKRT